MNTLSRKATLILFLGFSRTRTVSASNITDRGHIVIFSCRAVRPSEVRHYCRASHSQTLPTSWVILFLVYRIGSTSLLHGFEVCHCIPTLSRHFVARLAPWASKSYYLRVFHCILYWLLPSSISTKTSYRRNGFGSIFKWRWALN